LPTVDGNFQGGPLENNSDISITPMQSNKMQ